MFERHHISKAVMPTKINVTAKIKIGLAEKVKTKLMFAVMIKDK